MREGVILTVFEVLGTRNAYPPASVCDDLEIVFSWSRLVVDGGVLVFTNKGVTRAEC